ncbi:MAG: SRPBCC family protein [Actinomycetota bacterium]
MASEERAPVVRRVVIPAPRQQVWRALTSVELLSAWLGEVVELEARAGGHVVVREPDGSTRRGLVESVDPARSLVLRWRRLAGGGRGLEVGEATRVVFALEDDGAGTRVTVTEEPATMVAVGRGS